MDHRKVPIRLDGQGLGGISTPHKTHSPTLNMARILKERRERRQQPVQLPKGSVPREGLDPIP